MRMGMRPIPSDIQLEPVSPADVSPKRSPMHQVKSNWSNIQPLSTRKSPQRFQAGCSPTRHCSSSKKVSKYLDLENFSPSNSLVP